MSAPPEDRVGTGRRALVIGLVLLLLALAGVANATIKQHRAASGNGVLSAVSAAETTGGATSSAWYCAGPLPLGQRSEHARIAIGNVSDDVVRGELVVANESGVDTSQHLLIPARGAISLPLTSPGRSSFGAATVLLDGAGVGVEELISGSTGTDASPCVSHATSVQYLPGGATKDSSAIDLAVFDPGATPSVASVSFATESGPVAPPAFQQVPIEAGETLVLDVARYLPLQPLLGTTVSAGGGRVVVGALASTPIGSTTFPSLVAAEPQPESTWYFGPAPSGPAARQGFVVLNPQTSTARVSLNFVGSAGGAVLTAVVPGGGLIELAPPPDKSPTGARWAMVTASAPVIVTRETVLRQTGPSPGKTAAPRIAAAASGFPQPLPAGFALTPGSLVLARDWLVAGGQSDARVGELVTVANPSTASATVQLTPLSAGVPAVSVVVGPHGSAVVALPSTSGGAGTVTAEVGASTPIVVGVALYARGAKGSSGFSAPGAIPVD